jgi:hypothetical protein
MTEEQLATQARAQCAARGIHDDSDIAAAVRAKGVLVSLEITTWSARRLDKTVTQETNDRAGADSDAGRYNKHLLGGKVESFSAVIAAAGAARQAHYSQTLPWADEGARLLPIGNYFEYAKMIREERSRFKSAVAAFLDEYPQLVHAAAARLGDMYRPQDYPPVSDIAGKFTFRVNFSPVPAASDIRLDLPEEVTRHMEKSITARVTRSVDAAVRDGWERLYASVERIRDRLREVAAADPDGKQARLHASLFSGAVETAETLRRMNVLEDPQLDAMAARIIAELGALEPKELRKDPAAMQDTANAADSILSAMAGIYGRGAA